MYCIAAASVQCTEERACRIARSHSLHGQQASTQNMQQVLLAPCDTCSAERPCLQGPQRLL
jgi:hypothetical protein